jgi:hypothetical protein
MVNAVAGDDVIRDDRMKRARFSSDWQRKLGHPAPPD